MINHNYAPGRRIAATAATALLSLSACANNNKTVIELPEGNSVTIPVGTELYDGPATDTSNTDANNELGSIQNPLLLREYIYVNRGPGVSDMVCVDKDTLDKNSIANAPIGLAWKLMGDVCIKAEHLQEPNGAFVYPND